MELSFVEYIDLFIQTVLAITIFYSVIYAKKSIEKFKQIENFRFSMIILKK
jgi:hypothetical protein